MNQDSAEVKPGFTLKYFLLATVVALIPIIFGGVLGYFGNELTRDRKNVDVSATTSANLVSITGGEIPGKLDITLSTNTGQKQQISGLFRYTVNLANRSAEGIDNFDLFIIGPKHISWVDGSMSVTTTPPELASVLSVVERMDQPDTSRRHFVVSLLNGDQAMALTLSGFSVDPKIVASDPVSALIEKKDWTQRWVENANSGRSLSSLLSTKLIDATLDNVLVGETLTVVFLYATFVLFKGYMGAIFAMLLRTVRKTRSRGGRLPPFLEITAGLFGIPLVWMVERTEDKPRETTAPAPTTPAL